MSISNLKKTGWLTFLFLAPTLFSYSQSDTSLPYKIYDTAKQKEISLKKLIKRLGKQDVIFFGEEHNDSTAHELELALFQGIENRSPETALSLEMFQRDVQLILDEYTQGLISETNLLRDARPWNNYETDYKPLVEYAKKNHLPVIAANAPTRYTNRVTKTGLESLNDLSEAARTWLAPLPIDTLTGKYYENFSALMGGHQAMGNMKIYQSQNLWDATMAYSIAKFKQSHPSITVLHVNGRFHSDEKLGTYQQLKQHYAPHLLLRNISCFSDENFDQPHWEAFQNLADFVILTKPAK